MRIFRHWKAGWSQDRASWTEDVIFRTGRFCNIFRFHDRTSLWLTSQVLAPLHAAGMQAEALFNIFICRSYLVWEQSMAAVCTRDEATGCSYVPIVGYAWQPFEAKLGDAREQLGRLNRATVP